MEKKARKKPAPATQAESDIPESDGEERVVISAQTAAALEAADEALLKAKRALVNEARRIADQFNEYRNSLIGKPGIKFMGLAIWVASNEESVLRCKWIELIFKEGKVKLRKTVPNQNSERSHLGTLYAKAPEEFHSAIRDAELAMRSVRRQAKKVSEARRLILEAGAVGSGSGFAAKPEPQLEEDSDAMPQF